MKFAENTNWIVNYESMRKNKTSSAYVIHLHDSKKQRVRNISWARTEPSPLPSAPRGCPLYLPSAWFFWQILPHGECQCLADLWVILYSICCLIAIAALIWSSQISDAVRILLQVVSGRRTVVMAILDNVSQCNRSRGQRCCHVFPKMVSPCPGHP